jgi:hypothetical protein
VTETFYQNGLVNRASPPIRPIFHAFLFYNLPALLSFFGRNPEVLGLDKGIANIFVPFSLKFFFGEPPIPPGTQQKFPPQKASHPKALPHGLRHPTQKRRGEVAA